MHIHSEPEIVDLKKTGKLRTTLIHLGVAIVAVLIIPWVLNLITGPKIDEIRKSNPQYNNNSQLEYYKGRVNRVISESAPENSQELVLVQKLDVKPMEGPDKDQIFTLETQVNKISEVTKFKEGDTVVLIRVNTEGQQRYYISERYRLDQVYLSIMFFVVLVLILVGIRGVTALAGLVFSVLALTNFLIPMILIGQNVVWITFLTGLVIMAISLFLSHGFNKIIFISLAASSITITLSTLFSIMVVYFTKLTGTGSDDAYQLQYSNATIGLNFQGLFLSAMIIGTLGVLDDITTSQAATVAEISKANPKLTPNQLYKRGLNVGHEHIISLVNTLGLAYVSVALPLLMYYIIYNPQPLWVSFNSENIVEEVIRTIVGSSALLLAVPITTFLASRFLRHNKYDTPEKDHIHNEIEQIVELTNVSEPAPKSPVTTQSPSRSNWKTGFSKFNPLNLFKNSTISKKKTAPKELMIYEKTDSIKKNQKVKKTKVNQVSNSEFLKKIQSESTKAALKTTESKNQENPFAPPKFKKPAEKPKKAEFTFDEKPTELDVKGGKSSNESPENGGKRIQL